MATVRKTILTCAATALAGSSTSAIAQVASGAVARPSLEQNSATLATAPVASQGVREARQSAATSIGAGATSSTSSGIPDIIVTAQKRSQNLRDVPITITAITGTALRSKGLVNLTDLPDLVPGVRQNTPGGGSNAAISIRGIGQRDLGLHQEGPVAVYVDGAYIGLSTALSQPIFDIDHVEVLKGPQGTLFGRNATGGLIHFIDNQPTQAIDGYVTFQAGSYGKFMGEGAIGGSLGGAWSGRLSLHAETGGAYLNNLSGAADHNGVKDFAGRGQILYKPSADLSILFNVYGVKWPNQGGPASVTSRAIVNANGTPELPPSFAAYQAFCTALVGSAPAQAGANGNCFGSLPGKYSVNVADQGRYQGGYVNGSMTLQASIAENISLTSVSDYQLMRNNATQLPLDNAAGQPFFYTNLQPKADQYSQEVRLNEDSGRLKWVVGVYGLYIDNRSANIVDLRNLAAYGVRFNTAIHEKTASVAGFAEASYQLTPMLTAILGGRVTYDHKHGVNTSSCDTASTIPVDVCSFIAGSAPVPLVAFSGYNLSFGKTSWSGRAVVQWKPTDDIMLFVGVNRGTKAGGFNSGGVELYPLSAVLFGQEVLTNYEGGLKARFFDHKMSFEVSAFHYDYKNYQTFASRNGANQVFNVDATVNGAEGSLSFRPMRGLDLSAAMTYLDSTQNHVPVGNTFSDFVLPDSPKLSTNETISYSFAVASGKLTTAVSHAYVGRRSHNAVDFVAEESPAYDRFDARVAYDFFGDRLTAALSVRNLTDKLIYTSRVPFETVNGFIYNGIDLPRTIMGSVTYRFK